MNDASDPFEDVAQIMRRRRRRRDRIHRADFHAGREYAESERGVAVDDDLGLLRPYRGNAVLESQIGLGPGESGLEQRQIGLHDGIRLLAEGDADLLPPEFEVETEDAAQHPEHEHVLAASRIRYQRLAFALEGNR